MKNTCHTVYIDVLMCAAGEQLRNDDRVIMFTYNQQNSKRAYECFWSNERAE